MAMMSFRVTKSAPELVGPSAPTPFHTLPLSFTDRLPGMSFFLELILVFSRGESPASTSAPANATKGALREALVAYYPVAGRISNNPDTGELEVACSDSGVVFVEASADCGLGDVDHLAVPPLKIHKDGLLPSLPVNGSDDKSVIFMMQVTQFKCGGFTLGIKFNHAIFDGLGAAQFIDAIGEKARGLNELTTKPIWFRESIPNPPKPSKEIQMQVTFKFERHVFDIPLNYVDQLKVKFTTETGYKCTVFDIVAAMVWQCRTQAIGLAGGTVAALRFPINVRHEIKLSGKPLADGYYGNCIFHVDIQKPSNHVVGSPLFEIVRLIQDAKRDLPTMFMRWVEGGAHDDPPELASTYGLLNLSDWRRLGVFEVDYGWGMPMHVIPTNDGVHFGSCIFLNSPVPRRGVRLMTTCVVKDHVEAFAGGMEKQLADCTLVSSP